MNQDKQIKMLEELGTFYYQRAIQEFEGEEYETAVKNFIKVYEMGFYQEEILNFLYSCFITPNEEEFKKTYEANSNGLTSFPYEDTEIDFIPVSEDYYYLYNKKEKKFEGVLRLEALEEREKNFHSLLIADEWDVRQISQNLQRTEYRTLYYLLNEQKNKFYSFFKIPKFSELYLDNAICFENTDVMRLFFEEYPDYYLPKTIWGRNLNVYSAILAEIHETRKKNVGLERKNVFLSICIPAYNRGHMVIENVKQMLQLQYDSEIEIVVSDDGSTENVEGYFETAAIQDSRLKCMRFEKNQGYAANVLNVLEMASGQFAMLTSDENQLALENIGQLLNKLYQNRDKGIVSVTGYGPGFIPAERIKESVIRAGMHSVWKGMNMNTLAGCVFNMDIVHQYNILQRCQELRGNLYIELYVHMAVALFIGRYAECYELPLPVWIEGNSGGVGGFSEKGRRLLRYMTLESRIGQHESVLQLVEIFYPKRSEIYEWFFVKYLEKTYYLLSIARKCYQEEFDQKYEWVNVCKTVYEYSMNQMQELQFSDKSKNAVMFLYQKYEGIFGENI